MLIPFLFLIYGNFIRFIFIPAFKNSGRNININRSYIITDIFVSLQGKLYAQGSCIRTVGSVLRRNDF